MIQAVIRKGRVLAEEVPAPRASEGAVLIKVVNSCISVGTEVSGLTHAGKSLIRRAIEQPEKVVQTLNMARSAGIAETYRKVMGQVAAGAPTGYSVSGVVLAVGDGITDICVGDAVAAGGAGLANHAEYVDVPRNLVATIPRDLSFPKASTVTLGAIAMHGVRRSGTGLGEFCVVFGTGIMGQLAVQMLHASGARVIGVDLDSNRLQLAKRYGAEHVINPDEEDPIKAVNTMTGGRGADAVLFTAATGSSEPLSQAFRMCRRKGRVVLVGVSGMELRREDLYRNEIDLLMSTSYGPGRYDASYEQKGIDYPYAYVRWTENRNMLEYLRLVDSGAIDLDQLIGEDYTIERAAEAFERVKQPDRPLMVLLSYGMPEEPPKRNQLPNARVAVRGKPLGEGPVRVALVGAGSFATGVHLPNISALSGKYQLRAVMSRKGLDAKNAADRYGASYATSEFGDVLADSDVDVVMITTRHDTHAELTLKALQAGKHVFVEKPLATNREDLAKIESLYSDDSDDSPLLMVGFNRRFSMYAREIKKHVSQRVGPLLIQYRMNAGYLPPDHWVHEHGGRIVGEACHILDLMIYLTGSPVEVINWESLADSKGAFCPADNKAIIMKHADGSVCTVEYFSTGSRALGKEYMEAHFDEKTLVMDDYKSLTGYGLTTAHLSHSTPQKGHAEELEGLYSALSGETGDWPIPLWELLHTTALSLSVA